MKSAIVNFKDISDPKKNPTLCISAQRYTDNCVACKVLNNAFYKTIQVRKTDKEIANSGGLDFSEHKLVTIRLPVDEALKRLKCAPLISKSQLSLLYERDHIFEKKAAVQQDLDKIQEVLGK